MRKVLLLLYVCLLACNLILAQENPTQVKPQTTRSRDKSLSASSVAEARSEASESTPAGKLPVRRVVLYKNGVGYFEHLGRVRGSQDVHIDFTSAQLNDVLKSLTVLDLAGGRITGVDYNSEAPLARRLATLRLALGEKPSVSEFLGALRGARLEVRCAGGTVTGKLLSVERKTRTGTNWTVETDEISLISDSGEVRSVDLNPTTVVRIADRDLNTEVSKYLGLVASARDQDVRRMTISTAGTGERNLYVSYISEVPLWKTTYRLVLSSKPNKKPLLQGWAIVDNTVGEDWKDVELSLVAGAPHSFIQRLSEPYYGRRPVVPLPESVELSPQTHGATLLGGNGRLTGNVLDQSGAVIAGAKVRLLLNENGGLVSETTTDNNGRYSFSDIATAQTYRVEAESPGFKKYSVTQVNVAPGENQLNSQLQVGSTMETVSVSAEANTSVETSSSALGGNAGKLRVAHSPHVDFARAGVLGGAMPMAPPPIPTSTSLEAARGLTAAAASGQDLGDLFEYKLKDKVTLKKNQSALVPIAQTEIEAEKVSLWNGINLSGRPLRGLWLKNGSSLTLDSGSFSVLEDEVFAGEGLTDSIKPGERRIVSYATDLGLLVNTSGSSEPQRVRRVKISKGVMTQTSELRARTFYMVRNQEEATRALIIEHPVRADWTLVPGGKEPEERTPSMYRFRLEVPTKATASLPVEEVRVLSSMYQLSNLEADQVAVFVKQGTVSPDVASALRKITEQKAVVAQLEQEMESRQHDIDKIVDDQGRLRENMKALRGSAEEKTLLQRYTRQLDEQETHLDGLRKEIEATEAHRDKAHVELEKTIAELDIDTTL